MIGDTTEYSRSGRYAVLASALGGYWLDFYNILVISFLMVPMERDIHLSLLQVSYITSVTLAASVVGGIGFGIIADHFGRKNALMLSILTFSIAAILSAFSWNYASLLIFRAIAGIGIGGEWGVGATLYNEVWKPKLRGLGSAVIQSMALIGVVAAVIVSSWSLHAFAGSWGWRVALLVGAVPLPFLLLIRRYMPESKLWSGYDDLRRQNKLPPEKKKERLSLIEIFKGASLGRTIVWLFMLCGYMFSFYGFATFMPSYMAKSLHGAEGIEGATIIAMLGATLCFWAIGWLCDRFGRRKAMIGTVALTIVGYLGIYFGTRSGFYAGSVWSWPITWWYLVWTAGVGSACIFAPWMSELFPVETRSTATSTIYTCGRTMSAAAPAVVAILAASYHDLLTAMVVVGGGMVVVGIGALFLPETAGRQFSVIESKRTGFAASTEPNGSAGSAAVR